MFFRADPAGGQVTTETDDQTITLEEKVSRYIYLFELLEEVRASEGNPTTQTGLNAAIEMLQTETTSQLID